MCDPVPRTVIHFCANLPLLFGVPERSPAPEKALFQAAGIFRLQTPKKSMIPKISPLPTFGRGESRPCMPTRHSRKLFSELRRSRLLKLQAAVLFVTTFIDWVLMPFLTKLEGTHLAHFHDQSLYASGGIGRFRTAVFSSTSKFTTSISPSSSSTCCRSSSTRWCRSTSSSLPT